ncbi:hypothetical protein [Pseudohongiella sp. O18]|uniref:hypothetical protein n=1 Tax=Pseudohongiella sp. O18 TaxID=2904248 RepID=UPI001F38A602|nr:hypothetical protein [Pseudohongiella sp. O18]
MNRFEFDLARILGGKKPVAPASEPGDIKALRVTMPTKRLTDPDFDYVPACATDLKKTFRKVQQTRQKLING